MTRFLKFMLPIVVVGFTVAGFINVPVEKLKDVPQSQDVAVGLNIGDKAPELNYPDPNGKGIPLSSLKGKVVLIDFWASWCGPCRMENPNVVMVFEKYKNKKFKNGKGFTIYGVSLDNNKERWQQAIMGDRLNWESHVSDLKGWSSEASKQYKVYAIPTNFLIDGKGIILAKNLRGAALEATLSKYAVN